MEANEFFERNLRAVASDLEGFAKRQDVDGLLDYILEVTPTQTGVEVLVTSGGPTIWADTQDGKVHATWNGFSASRDMSNDAIKFLEYLK